MAVDELAVGVAVVVDRSFVPTPAVAAAAPPTMSAAPTTPITNAFRKSPPCSCSVTSKRVLPAWIAARCANVNERLSVGGRCARWSEFDDDPGAAWAGWGYCERA